MIISVDAMGGDYAPEEIVQGAVIAAREHQVGIILVGPEARLRRELVKWDTCGLDIEIVHTDEWLIEGEHPALALRTKRCASIAVATRLVKEGRADAVVGVGPTGGVVAAALYHLGTMDGITRPVVGGLFLGFTPQSIMMDLGGNVDCRPDQLLDFAVVGSVYARKVMKITNPTVGIASIGAEEGKGNQQVLAAYPLLKKSGLNFIGNLEGYDIPMGKANVIICDGFVGNILVKFCENLGRVISQWLVEKLRDKLAESEIRILEADLLRNTVPSDITAGGPLLAVNGVVLVAHGRSHYPQVASAIAQAKAAVESNLVDVMRQELAAMREKVKITVV
jgi:glycerol-3-phosphate acyltransferase PlsX